MSRLLFILTKKMKHLKNTSIAVLLLVLAACSSDKKEIEINAMGYLQATGNYLIDEAMPYATQETRETTLTFLRDKLIPYTPQAYIKSNTPATIVINDITIQDDTARVQYTKTTPIKTLENEIMLVQENGQWLVYVPLALPDTINAPVSPAQIAPLPDSTGK